MFNVKKRIGFSVYIIFTIIASISISIKYWNPINNTYYVDLLIYLFLMVIINSFPLKVGKRYIVFTLPLTLTVFFEYGLAIELWLTQISILISLLVSNNKRSYLAIIRNQLMFAWMSIISGVAFYLAGGRLGFSPFETYSQLIPIFLYIFVYFAVNSIIIYVFRSFSKTKDVSFFSEDLFWDAATLIFTLPFGLIFYSVKTVYGVYWMLIISIIFVSVIYLLKLYSELQQSHKKIETLNEVNITFTSELNLEKTINALQEAIRDLLNFEYSNIFMVKGSKLKIISSEDYYGTKFYSNSEDLDTFEVDGFFGDLVLSKNVQIIDSDADIYLSESKINYLQNCKSLISLPMVWHGQVTGVIVLVSKEESYFSKKDIKILEILASQAGVAIRNATTYQLTEERTLIDELTDVYNFRAFTNLLNDLVIEAEVEKEEISLLMIDLDYFKKVNDQYGHEAGNTVLKEVANLLKFLTRRIDIVSRYGGEEFTVIIPNTDSEGAKAIAERIRITIEQHSFVIKDNSNNERTINITASIGVATYPDMVLSANELIRFADRALYIGSKQKGRNKVSIYKEEI